MKTTFRPLGIVLSSAMIAGGCGTMSVPESIALPADSYPNKAVHSGLLVAAHPVTDKDELNKAFNCNLLEKGILPILVVVENQSSTASFVVPKEGVMVVDAKSQEAGTGAIPKAASPDAAQALALITFGSLTSLLALKASSDAQVIQHNVCDKAYYSQTVSRGQKAFGYLYFQVPKGSPPLSQYHIIVNATDASTNERIAFNFPITEVH